MKYINENLNEKLTLESVADEFGYSKWYFCELFRQYTGSTFVSYLRHRRMQFAAQAILGGEKLTDVALSCGYDSPGGFGKAFLTEFGCLPKEFKNNARRATRRAEERRDTMLQLSDRCEMLRRNAVETKPVNKLMYGQRDYYAALGAAAVPDEKLSNTELIAESTVNAVRNVFPLIQDGELIVGFNYSDAGYEYASESETEIRKKFAEGGLITPEMADGFFAARSRADSRHKSMEPSEPRSEHDALLDSELAAMGFCLTWNHTVLGYEKVLKLGFEGLRAETERLANGSDAPMYAAAVELCDAGCEIGPRFADAAEALAQSEQDERRKEELLEIAKVCRNVPARPAQSFREAVQSLWFAHMINTWEDGINANSLGRLDQILYPYYKKDIESGELTRGEAFELICCLWIKLYRDYDVQQSCVGGCLADGSSAVNELSYMMLDATEALDFVRCLSVRYSAKTDKAFMRRALEVVGHVGKGVPFFFNDDVMIPALVSRGISLEDARGYTQIGCVETVIPGKSNPHAVTGRCNLLKALEYALVNGKSMMDETKEPGLRTGELSELSTFALLREAVEKQTVNLVESACRMVESAIDPGAFSDPRPYKSLLTEGCLESGRDFNNRGAKYDYYEMMLVGVPNLADSLAAIRELVYKKKLYTLDELVYQLKNNWPDEAMRLDFLRKAPKFGNDIAEVDSIAAEFIDFACDELARVSDETGVNYFAQPFTFLWMFDHGAHCAASADGRRKGEILAYSLSPMQGRDFNGFTALLNSLASLPTKKTPGTTSAIVEVDPRLFSDSSIPYFADIMLAAAEKGVCNVQFNVVDADTLLDAQKNPDKYRNLAVRVSGFSQKFYLLDKPMQDHIINRTKHRVM